MKRPVFWFLPIYGLLVALVLSVFYLGSVSAKSGRQKTSADILNEIKSTVEPGGKINSANQAASEKLIGQIKYCINQDAIAAVNHLPTIPACIGTP